MEEICNMLGMPRTEDFGKYLGLPTVNGKETKATCQDVVARVDRKLAGWKAKCLSLVGCVALIQATITAIPAYNMQTAEIPRSALDELDRKVRIFLLGGTIMERKTHLVSWEVVTKEKENGGLS